MCSSDLFPSHDTVLEKFQKRFNLLKPIIIADLGLLSKSNIEQLKAKKIADEKAEKAIYIIDGVYSDKKVADNINPKDITTVNVYKGDDAVKLYGDRAKCCNEQGDGLHKTSSYSKFILLDFFTMFTLQRLNKD